MLAFSLTISLGTCLLLLHAAQASGPTLYHTSEEIINWYSTQSVQQNSVVRFDKLGTGDDLQAVPLATFSQPTTGQGSTSGPSPTARPVALLVFGEHSREVITSEVALWLSRVLVGDVAEIASWEELGPALRDGDVPAGEGAGGGAGDVLLQLRQYVLDHLLVQIIPIENMSGRQRWESGYLCQRKTASGVDLNRNWAFAWSNLTDTDSDEYGGTQPFSEPQSRAVRDLVLRQPPAAFINCHSGEWAVYVPWDSKHAYSTGLPADMQALLNTTEAVCHCQAGPSGVVSPYLAYGTSMDWMHTQLHVPYPMTLEFYGSSREGLLTDGRRNQPLSSFKLEPLESVATSRRLSMLRGPRPEVNWRDSLSPSWPFSHTLRSLLQHGNKEAQWCFAAFNPVLQTEYRDVVARWVVTLLLMLRHVADHPPPRDPGDIAAAVLSSGPSPSPPPPASLDAVYQARRALVSDDPDGSTPRTHHNTLAGHLSVATGATASVSAATAEATAGTAAATVAVAATQRASSASSLRLMPGEVLPSATRRLLRRGFGSEASGETSVKYLTTRKADGTEDVVTVGQQIGIAAAQSRGDGGGGGGATAPVAAARLGGKGDALGDDAEEVVARLREDVANSQLKLMKGLESQHFFDDEPMKSITLDKEPSSGEVQGTGTNSSSSISSGHVAASDSVLTGAEGRQKGGGAVHFLGRMRGHRSSGNGASEGQQAATATAAAVAGMPPARRQSREGLVRDAVDAAADDELLSDDEVASSLSSVALSTALGASLRSRRGGGSGKQTMGMMDEGPAAAAVAAAVADEQADEADVAGVMATSLGGQRSEGGVSSGGGGGGGGGGVGDGDVRHGDSDSDGMNGDGFWHLDSALLWAREHWMAGRAGRMTSNVVVVKGRGTGGAAAGERAGAAPGATASGMALGGVSGVDAPLGAGPALGPGGSLVSVSAMVVLLALVVAYAAHRGAMPHLRRLVGAHALKTSAHTH